MGKFKELSGNYEGTRFDIPAMDKERQLQEYKLLISLSIACLLVGIAIGHFA